jgi:hypothetical protein
MLDPWLTDKKFKCYKKMDKFLVVTLDDVLSNSAGDQQKMSTSDMEKTREK